MIPENETALRLRHPDLLTAVRNSPARADVELVGSRQGPMTLIWRKSDGQTKYVHSPTNPEAESARIAQAVLGPGSSRVARALMVGHGAGHLIRAMSSRVDELWVLVTDLPLLSFLCDRIDLSDLFLNGRIRWIFGTPHDLRKSLKRLLDGVPSESERSAIRTVLHPPFIEMIPKDQSALLEVVDELRRGRDTEDLIGPMARSNLLENFPALASPGVAALFGTARGRPVVVAGAGPSLDSSLSTLRDLRPSAFIVAVDTVSEGLADAGIPPDLVISVDPREDSNIHFTDSDKLRAARLVFTPISHPAVVRRFEGRRFLAVPQSHFLLKSVEKKMAHKGVLLGGGSVSIIAAALAASMEPSYVCLVGIDFGIETSESGRNARFYSRLASYLRWAYDARAQQRFSSSETTEYEILSSEIRKTDRDPDGSSPRLKSYASEFRHVVKSSPVPFYTLGPAGLEGVRSGILPCVSAGPARRPVDVPVPDGNLSDAKEWLETLGIDQAPRG